MRRAFAFRWTQETAVPVFLLSICGLLAVSSVFSQTPPEPAVRIASKPVAFASKLPDSFESSKPVERLNEGILVPEHTYIRTRDANYLHRDFRLELWLTIGPKLPTAFVGIGSGIDGDHATPVNSIFMVAHPDGRITLSTREGYGDANMGNELDPGEYVVQIEKTGTAVTFSIGADNNGEFTPDITQTFYDISKTPADFTDKNMHLFFGGGQYRQYRFTTDAPTANVPPSPTASDPPGANLLAAASGLNVITLPAPGLSPEFECDGTFSVFKDAVVVPSRTYIRTKQADFLSKDFIMDLWLTVDPKNPEAFVGVGSGRNDDQQTPVNSIYMVVKPDGEINLATKHGHGDQHIGKEFDPGEYVVRLAKKGLAVTYSIGTDKDGQFAPDVTRTVLDITKTPATFTERNMHVFFGGGQYRQIRFWIQPSIPPRNAPKEEVKPANTIPPANT